MRWTYALVLVACSGPPSTVDGGSDAAPDVDAQAPVAIFGERFGDSSDQVAFGLAVAADGSLVIAGALAGTADFGGGALASAGLDDVFVAKLDAAGKHVWSARFGDGDEQWAEHIAIDGAGNVAVVGSMSGSIDFGGGSLASAVGRDVYVAVFDAGGKYVWSKSFGSPGTNEDAWGVAFDPSGNVLVTGGAEGEIDFGCGAPAAEGEQSIFVAKLDPKGACVFSRRVGNAEEQIGFAIASDAAGDVLVTGRFEGTIDFGVGPMTATLRDAFVAGWDASGVTLFSRDFGDPSGSGMAEGRGIAAGASGIVVAGKFSGTLGGLASAGDTDVFLVGLDATGATRFERRFGDAAFQNAFDLAPAGADVFVASGDFGGALDFGTTTPLVARAHDGWVARFDGKTGSAISAYALAGGDVTAWASAASGGRVAVAGGFSGTLDLGGIPLVSSGGSDVFAGLLP